MQKHLFIMPALAYLVALSALQYGFVLSETGAMRGEGEANCYSAPSVSLLWHTNPEVGASAQFAPVAEPSAKNMSKFWLAAVMGEAGPKASDFQAFCHRAVGFPVRLRQRDLLFPFHSFL